MGDVKLRRRQRLMPRRKLKLTEQAEVGLDSAEQWRKTTVLIGAV